MEGLYGFIGGIVRCVLIFLLVGVPIASDYLCAQHRDVSAEPALVAVMKVFDFNKQTQREAYDTPKP